MPLPGCLLPLSPPPPPPLKTLNPLTRPGGAASTFSVRAVRTTARRSREELGGRWLGGRLGSRRESGSQTARRVRPAPPPAMHPPPSMPPFHHGGAKGAVTAWLKRRGRPRRGEWHDPHAERRGATMQARPNDRRMKTQRRSTRSGKEMNWAMRLRVGPAQSAMCCTTRKQQLGGRGGESKDPLPHGSDRCGAASLPPLAREGDRASRFCEPVDHTFTHQAPFVHTRREHVGLIRQWSTVCVCL